MDYPTMGKIVLCWFSWCFMHSFLISTWFTGHLQSLTGKKIACYRLCFNIISIAALVPAIWYQLSFEQTFLFHWNGPWRIVQVCLTLYGSYMFYVGRKRYDMPFFLGTRQLRAYLAGKTVEPLPFRADYRGGVRHPWYSGSIAMVLASGTLTDITLASKSVLISYLIIGTFLEERKLVKEYGQSYIQYQQELPMLFPWQFLSLGKSKSDYI